VSGSTLNFFFEFSDSEACLQIANIFSGSFVLGESCTSRRLIYRFVCLQERVEKGRLDLYQFHYLQRRLHFLKSLLSERRSGASVLLLREVLISGNVTNE